MKPEQPEPFSSKEDYMDENPIVQPTVYSSCGISHALVVWLLSVSAAMVITLFSLGSSLMALETGAGSSEVARIKIAQMETRQRALESQYRFAEAAALHAESINVAKAGGLPKSYVRRELAIQKTYELLAAMTREQQTEYLGVAKYILAARALEKKGNYQGACDVHAKGLEVLRKLLPEEDQARLVAEVDALQLRSNLPWPAGFQKEVETLKVRCRKQLGSDDKCFAQLLNIEISIYEKRSDWKSVVNLCEELDASYTGYGERKPSIIDNQHRRALALMKSGQLDSAWALAQKSIAATNAIEDADKGKLEYGLLVTSGRILMAKGDCAQAETYFRKGRKACSVYSKEVFPEGYLDKFHNVYVECLTKLGKSAEADELKADVDFP